MRTASLRALANVVRALSELAAQIEQIANEESSGGDAAILLPWSAAARFAGCSTHALAEARRKGELPVYGRGRARAVRRADLEKWLESRKLPAIEAAPTRALATKAAKAALTADSLDESGVEDVEQRAARIARRQRR